MHVTLVRSDCDDKPICPAVWRTDRGTGVVQGWATDRPDTVEVPLSLLEGIAVVGTPTVTATDHGTVLVRGEPVTDAEALAMMDIPARESAVELPVAV